MQAIDAAAQRLPDPIDYSAPDSLQHWLRALADAADAADGPRLRPDIARAVVTAVASHPSADILAARCAMFHLGRALGPSWQARESVQAVHEVIDRLAAMPRGFLRHAFDEGWRRGAG